MSQETPFHTETVNRFWRRTPLTSNQLWDELEILHPGDPKAQLQAWIDQTCRHIRAGAAVEPDEDDGAVTPAEDEVEEFRAFLDQVSPEDFG